VVIEFAIFAGFRAEDFVLGAYIGAFFVFDLVWALVFHSIEDIIVIIARATRILNPNHIA
jgi:hypothetical protein